MEFQLVFLNEKMPFQRLNVQLHSCGIQCSFIVIAPYYTKDSDCIELLPNLSLKRYCNYSHIGQQLKCCYFITVVTTSAYVIIVTIFAGGMSQSTRGNHYIVIKVSPLGMFVTFVVQCYVYHHTTPAIK